MSPYNIRNPSFLLSVCATLGIIVFARIFNFARLFKIKNSVVKRIVNAVFGSVSVSLSACVGCLPVFVLMFGKVNLLSPLSNLLLILPVQLMFYMGFAAVLFPFLASFAGAVVSVLYKFVSYVTDFEYGLKYKMCIRDSICGVARAHVKLYACVGRFKRHFFFYGHHDLNAVSYTHLDVYKRQALHVVKTHQKAYERCFSAARGADDAKRAAAFYLKADTA